MLLGKGQFLKLWNVLYTQQAVERWVKGMSSQLSVEQGTHARESVGLVGFSRELCAQLAGERFEELADWLAGATDGSRDLFFLTIAGLGKVNTMVLPEPIRERGTDVGLVADDD